MKDHLMVQKSQQTMKKMKNRKNLFFLFTLNNKFGKIILGDNMKDRGFTLVELLAIIVLLSLLALIIFPDLIASFEKKESEIDGATKDLIFSSTDQYIEKHMEQYNGETGTTYCIQIADIDTDIGIPVDVSKYYDKGVEFKVGKSNSYTITTCEED